MRNILSIPTKWKYIVNRLKDEGAPQKVINAALEIDHEMRLLNLGNTYEWKRAFTIGTIDNINTHDLVRDESFCSACKECNGHCANCRLGNPKGCTPRSKYADNYFFIVDSWLSGYYRTTIYRRR